MKYLITILMSFSLLAFSSSSFAYPFYDIQFPNGEETIIRNFMGNGGTAKTVNKVEDRGSTYLISILEENGDITKILLKKEDLTPILNKTVSKDGKIKKYVNYLSGGKVDVAIPNKKIRKVLKVKNAGYDRFSLFYLFRGFPFGTEDKIIFDIVMHDPDNIRVVKMYVKYLGEEEIEVLAGKFRCYKLEMGCARVVDNLIWPYKYYFWFTTDSFHHFVKYQGREMDLSILTNELESYRIGDKIHIKGAINKLKEDNLKS